MLMYDDDPGRRDQEPDSSIKTLLEAEPKRLIVIFGIMDNAVSR